MALGEEITGGDFVEGMLRQRFKQQPIFLSSSAEYHCWVTVETQYQRHFTLSADCIIYDVGDLRYRARKNCKLHYLYRSLILM